MSLNGLEVLMVDEGLSQARSEVCGSGVGFRGEYEIDLLELFGLLWRSKWKVILSALVAGAVGILFSIYLPNQYKSEGVFAPAEQDGANSGLMGKYGGLAAMAGISIGGAEGNRIEQAIELLKSWSFLKGVIRKYNLKPDILAVKKWDSAKNELIYDESIFDSANGRWLGVEPSDWDAYKLFAESLTITHDSNTGMLRISVEHYSARLACEWVKLLAKEINVYFQHKDIESASKSIKYLSGKIAETSVAEMQSVFYGMIEEQTKTLMLAEVNDEYLIETVVPATVPEEKFKPKRALIVVMFGFLGGLASILVVFFRLFIFRSEY